MFLWKEDDYLTNEEILEKIKNDIEEFSAKKFDFNHVMSYEDMENYMNESLKPYQGKDFVIECPDGNISIVNKFEVEIDKEASTNNEIHAILKGYYTGDGVNIFDIDIKR